MGASIRGRNVSDFLPSLAYLSAAPRLSTRPEAEASGPRAHVLGVMRGFRQLGWDVRPYILGDELPGWVAARGSEHAFSGRGLRTLVADGLRLLARSASPRRALARTGAKLDWAYERFSPFQSIGRTYQARGIPWILETNGVLFLDAVRDRHNIVLWQLARRLELEAYRDCDVLVCVSPSLREAVTRGLQIPSAKTVVSETAVDTDLFNPPATTPCRHFEGFTIGFVGRLYIWTGLEFLFRAVAELDSEDRSRTNIVVVGDGEAGKSLREMAAAYDLQKRVHFTGQISMDEVPSYIAGFDVGYVAPEPAEGLRMYFSPMKLTEYLAMERPALGADHAGIRSLIDEGETGFLFEPGDLQSLKAAIRKAKLSESGLHEMGRKGRRIVLEKHTWSVRVSQLINDIRAVLSRRTPPARTEE